MQQNSGKNIMLEDRTGGSRKYLPSQNDQSSFAESSNYHKHQNAMVQDGGTGTGLKRIVLQQQTESGTSNPMIETGNLH